MFDEINIFNDSNNNLKKLFFFYFAVAVCGYLGLMMYGYPYSDDHCRYLVNINVGTLSSARYLTLMIEIFTYLSTVITDAAPFSQILSCAFLSYTAVICLKIFKIDLNDKLQILCFAPVVVNPYMLEIMLFRFDNPFSTLALLLVVASAYLSSFNAKKFWIPQTAILFLSFFMYQIAASAYFIICAYTFLKEIRDGKTLKQTISEMRYWAYTILTVACCYFPFTHFLKYSVAENGKSFAIPKDWESIKIIAANGYKYFSNLYMDWSDNTIGQIFFTLFAIFVINMLVQTYRKTKSIVSVTSSCLGIFIFSLCPLGTCIILRIISFAGNESILPRCLYSFGLLISLVCYENYKIFGKIKIARRFFAFLMVILCLWNIIFLNSAANVIRYFRMIQQNVLYDISKDIYEITNKNPKISGVCVTGSIKTNVTVNFVKSYPIIDRLIPEKWRIPYLCQIALMNPDFCDGVLKYLPLEKTLEENRYRNKKKIKKTSHYDVYTLDDKIVVFKLRNKTNYDDNCITYAQIKDEVDKKTSAHH